MARTIAALIRHGDYQQLSDTPSAHQPYPLNDRGIQQAKDCAPLITEFAQREKLAICAELDCSNLLRAWQTAQLLAKTLHTALDAPSATLYGFDALSERGVGSVANLTIAQIEQILETDPRYDIPPPGWKADSNYRLPFPGAESLLEAGDRVSHHIERRMRSLKQSSAHDCLKLFVGHGAAFRHAAFLMGVLPFDALSKLSMYHASPVFLEWVDGHWVHCGGQWKERQAAEESKD
jgi:broad specificity phosphatase PhoE